jgi:hypothetical protein
MKKASVTRKSTGPKKATKKTVKKPTPRIGSVPAKMAKGY